jgi:hypothetical protein
MITEEIEQRIEEAKERAIEKQKERETTKEEKKAVTRKILEQGFRLRYYDRVAFAYDENTAFFTVRSRKDHFCRPAARRVLLRHIEEGTHTFPIDIQDAEGRGFPLEKELRFELTAGLVEKTRTAKHEMPTDYRKQLQRKISTAMW